MKNLLILCFCIFCGGVANAQIPIETAKRYYLQAQNAKTIEEAIRLSGNAVKTIRQYLTDYPDANLLFTMEAVIPMAKFNADKCLSVLALSKKANKQLDQNMLNDYQNLLRLDIAFLFTALDLNDKIEFLWGTLNKEDVYYIQGCAKYFYGQPYYEDLQKAGEKGKQFLQALKPNTLHGYSIYHNHRFGFYLTYPSYLYSQEENEHTDGQSFFSYDGTIKLTSSARFNIDGESIGQLAQFEKSLLVADGCSITYSAIKNNWMVLSGYTTNGNIFYQKTVVCSLFSPGYNDMVNIIATAYVQYPQSEKTKGDQIIKQFSKFPYK